MVAQLAYALHTAGLLVQQACAVAKFSVHGFENTQLLCFRAHGIFYSRELIMKVPFPVRSTRTIISTYISDNELIKDNKLIFDALIDDSDSYYQVLTRALILEFHKENMKGNLKAETSEERYEYFFHNQLQDKSFVGYFFEQYPPLKLIIDNIIKNSIESVQSIYKIIQTKSKYIESEFKISDLTPVKFRFTGDRHVNHLRNIIFFFKDKELIFKHRSNSGQRIFKKFINIISEDIEFIPYINKCIKIDQISVEEWVKETGTGYYKGYDSYKYGVICAIATALNIQDLHFENIIYSTKGPVIIDYECAMTPSIENIQDRFNVLFALYKTGMLPFSVTSKSSGKNLDLGALYSSKNRTIPQKLHYIVDDFTDRLRLEYDFPATLHSSSVSQTKEETFTKSDAFLAYRGFKDAIESISKNSKELIDAINFSLNEDCYTRVVLKPTQYYYDVLRKYSHPYYSQDTSNFMENIKNELMEAGSERDSACLIEEIGSIFMAGTPIYSIHWNSTELLNSNNQLVFQYTKSPLISSSTTIEQLKDENNISKIILLFKKAVSGKVDRSGYKNKIEKPIDSFNIFRVLDNEVARLQDSIDTINNTQYMFDLVESGNSKFEVRLISNSLYSGLSGIYFSLLIGSHALNLDKYSYLREILIKSLDNFDNLDFDPGVFSGEAGAIYSLLVEDCLGGEKLPTDLITNKLEISIEKCIETQSWDILSGSSGLLLLLHRMGSRNLLKKSFISDSSKKIIRQLAELVEIKEINGKETGWWNFNKLTMHLGGYAHGVAGVAHALEPWQSDATAKKLFLLAINAQTELRAPNGIWKDLRLQDDEQISSPNSWCHGSLGISSVIPCKGVSTKSLQFDDYSLCHGYIGDLIYSIQESSINTKSLMKKVLNHKVCNSKDPIPAPDLLTEGLFLGRAGYIYLLSVLEKNYLLKYNPLFLRVGL